MMNHTRADFYTSDVANQRIELAHVVLALIFTRARLAWILHFRVSIVWLPVLMVPTQTDDRVSLSSGFRTRDC